MQQKVQFISTVVHEPELIILDEPFSGFDPINANLIRDEILRLHQLGSTIIFSTHRMETVEQLCDHIALINKSKKVLDGRKDDIKRQFRTYTFKVEGFGSLPDEDIPFQLLSQQNMNEPGKLSVVFKIAEGQSPNDLIAWLAPHIEIHHFEEEIPSMGDIFIKTVQDSSNEL
jgi:ABC-2 type transport system ATP-binding protein